MNGATLLSATVVVNSSTAKTLNNETFSFNKEESNDENDDSESESEDEEDFLELEDNNNNSHITISNDPNNASEQVCISLTFQINNNYICILKNLKTLFV